MRNLANSEFVFGLISKHEIFNKSGKINAFTDEAYQSFCKEYEEKSISRDLALDMYVCSTPNLFRCHLPHSQWVLGVFLSVVWYYDEVIITDPVLQIIHSDIRKLEQKKSALQELLSFFIKLQESIKGGYLLFAGNKIFPNKTSNFQSEAKLLVETPNILDAFESFSQLVKKPSRLNENPDDNLIQLEVMYQGLWGHIRTMGMYIPPHVFNSNKLANGINYDFMSPYERLHKEELIALNKIDLLDSLKTEYCKDISVVLESITNASRINSPVLFYREVDCKVAQCYASLNSSKDNGIIADTSIYDCSLPYFEGISPEQLFLLRQEIPLAFQDFRGFLFELVKKTMKATDDPTEIKFRIDREIQSLIRKLEVEMKGANRKFNSAGLITPLVVITGSLGLFSSGIDYTKLASALFGASGIVKAFTAYTDRKSDIEKAALNPVYFLWKSHQNKP